MGKFDTATNCNASVAAAGLTKSKRATFIAVVCYENML